MRSMTACARSISVRISSPHTDRWTSSIPLKADRDELYEIAGRQAADRLRVAAAIKLLRLGDPSFIRSDAIAAARDLGRKSTPGQFKQEVQGEAQGHRLLCRKRRLPARAQSDHGCAPDLE